MVSVVVSVGRNVVVSVVVRVGRNVVVSVVVRFGRNVVVSVGRIMVYEPHENTGK